MCKNMIYGDLLVNPNNTENPKKEKPGSRFFEEFFIIGTQKD